MSLTDLSNGFRDEWQLMRVRRVVHDRLADDRDQGECRYLMRLWWQLSTELPQLSLAQLRENVHEPKLATAEALIDALRMSPEQVDAWCAQAELAYPVAMDRGYKQESSPEPPHQPSR